MRTTLVSINDVYKVQYTAEAMQHPLLTTEKQQLARQQR